MFQISLFLLYLLMGFLAFRQCYKRDEIFEHFPSLAWFFLIALPFILQFLGSPGEATSTQALGIAIIGISLALGDIFAKFKWSKQLIFPMKITHSTLIYSLLTLVLAAQLIYLFMLPKIPLFHQLFLDKTPSELVALRELSEKFASTPLALTYLAQSSLYIAAPLVFIGLLKSKKFLLGFSFLLFELFFSRINLAKGPIFIFFGLCFMGCLSLLTVQKRKNICLGMIISACAFLICAASCFFYLKSNLQLTAELRAKTSEIQGLEYQHERVFTLADQYRIFVKSPEFRNHSYIVQRGAFYFYRVFLVSSEVANHWYTYFLKVRNNFIGLYGLTPETRNANNFLHPANEVGVWAYYQAFPKRYLESNYAYSSIDADAFARFSWFGILASALIILLLRMVISSAPGGSMTLSLRICCLTLLACLLPQASIQAILISHGLVWYLGLAYLFTSLEHASE